MREVFSMWRHTRMVVLVALSAALYAAVLIPFKGLVLIPGITEIRAAGALPVVLGLLFGPAGAWGAAIGNLIGDFFGTLGIYSFFGFIGNFYFAYVPYKIWRGLGLVDASDPEPLHINTKKKMINFVAVALLGSMSCALIIGWGLELLRLYPFATLATIISINNSLSATILGLPLMMVLYPRIKKWDLLWTDIVDEDEVKGASISWAGTLSMVAGILGGLTAGMAAAMGLSDQAVFAVGSGRAQLGNAGVLFLAGAGVLLNIAGGMLRLGVTGSKGETG